MMLQAYLRPDKARPRTANLMRGVSSAEIYR